MVLAGKASHGKKMSAKFRFGSAAAVIAASVNTAPLAPRDGIDERRNTLMQSDPKDVITPAERYVAMNCSLGKWLSIIPPNDQSANMLNPKCISVACENVHRSSGNARPLSG